MSRETLTFDMPTEPEIPTGFTLVKYVSIVTPVRPRQAEVEYTEKEFINNAMAQRIESVILDMFKTVCIVQNDKGDVLSCEWKIGEDCFGGWVVDEIGEVK